MNNNSVTWVIDTYIIDSLHGWIQHNFDVALEVNNCNVIKTKYIPFSDRNPKINLDTNSPYVIYGTHGYIKNARKEGYTKGIFCKEDNLSVSTLIEKYPDDWILNNGAIYYNSLFKFLENREFPHTKFHIRPNSVTKHFAGFVYDSEEETLEELRESFSYVEEDCDIYVSKPKQIDAEMRYVIADNEVIGRSTYRHGGILDVRIDTYPQADKLADKVSKYHWQPDKAYVVDIAKVGESFKVIELNSFSCAGFYACNLRDIVYNMNKIMLP